MNLLKDAIYYLDHKISVIPVGGDKKPLIAWKEYQDRLPTKEEVQKWWELYPDAQIGFVTGKISKITVVDVEKDGKYDWLPQNTTISTTGGGGRHYFYQYCEGVKNSARIKELVDIRGDGGYVIAPPSVSDKGKYEWLQKRPMLKFPKYLFEVDKKEYKKYDNDYQGYGEGQRNDQMAKYIGHLLAKVHPSEWETLAWNTILSANEKNDPPLSEYELKAVFQSIAGAEQHNDTKRWYEQEIEEKVEFVKKEDYKLRYTWGTENLNNNFAIIKRANFIVVGAKRSAGKTTYTFDMACKNAKLGHKVLYISLEMDGQEIKEDFARKYSGMTIPEEFTYDIPEHKQKAFERKLGEINNITNLKFEGVRRGGSVSWESIIGLIGKYPDIDLIFIDNLDLIEGKEMENDLTKQKRIVKSIMSFTSDNKIPIVLIHHYRKQGASKDYGMDELSGSGKISDGADMILKITRNQDAGAVYPEKYNSKLFLQKARGYKEAIADVYFIKGTFVDDPPEINFEESMYQSDIKEIDLKNIKF